MSVPGSGRHNLLHGSVHISCPFCRSVCGLSLFIVWSPSDQVTELCKLHFGSDKGAGCHFDYCTLWHGADWMNHQDGCVWRSFRAIPRPDCGGLKLIDYTSDTRYNHIKIRLSHLVNPPPQKNRRKKKLQNTQMQMYKLLSVTTTDHRR